jgi:hypothetical protein
MPAFKNAAPTFLLGSGGAAAGAALKLSAADTVVVATAGTDEVVAFAASAGSAGDYVAVQEGIVQYGIASAAISAGAKLAATTGGKLVTTTTDGHIVVGYAKEAAGADGDLFQFVRIQYRNTAP